MLVHIHRQNLFAVAAVRDDYRPPSSNPDTVDPVLLNREMAVTIVGTFNARAHIMLHDVDLNGNGPQHGGSVREIQQERKIEKLITVAKVVLAGAAVFAAAGAARRFIGQQVTRLLRAADLHEAQSQPSRVPAPSPMQTGVTDCLQ